MYVVCSFFFFFQKTLWRYLCSLSSAAGLTLTFPLFIVFLCVSCSHSITATWLLQPGLKHHPAFFLRSSLMQQHLLLQFHSVQKTKPAMARQHRISPRNNADVSGGVSFFSHSLIPDKNRGYSGAARAKGPKTPAITMAEKARCQHAVGISVGCIKLIAPMQHSVSLACTGDSKECVK